jgi:hypothetical protein
MKKRVGLMSYHFLHNHGTMLQAYALQKRISDLGHEAEYIDYRFREIEQRAPRKSRVRRKRIFAYLRHSKYYILKGMYRRKFGRKDRIFDAFYEKYVRRSAHQYATIQMLEVDPPSYDIYIVGSDQVWNPNLSCASPAYFLNYVRDNRKKASYAPSLGVHRLDPDQEKTIHESIVHFEHLSCRERSGATILSRLTGREVAHVLDPTMLLDSKTWEGVMTKDGPSPPYVLCYYLGDTRLPREYARELEKSKGMKTYYIAISPLDYLRRGALFDVGPSEFLSLIKNASLVCTDSYHGIIFSILFQRPFNAFLKRKETEKSSDNTRIRELLALFELEDRLVESKFDPAAKQKEIDYSGVVEKMERLQRDSEDYLGRVLNS